MTEIVLPEGQERFKLNEVCKAAKVQPYMLRFWATEFPGLEAEKSGTGQRLYSRSQVELILEIRRLLFDEGLTIAGAKKRLAKEGVPSPTQPADSETEKPKKRNRKRARKATEAASSEATESSGEVDKEAGERVQRLLLVLRGVRDELRGLADELKR